jgi:osmotically-inducible protein OsmY
MRRGVLVLVSAAIFSSGSALAQWGLPPGSASEIAAQTRNNAALKGAVQNALRDAGISQVHVRVHGEAVVFLSGRLSSKEEVELAVSTASSVKGVASVRNHLKVR